MSFYGDHPVLLISIIAATIIIGIVVFNVLYINYSGQPVPIPETPRNVQTIGSGQPLTYAILGDSTAVGQGGNYNTGIAQSTALFIAQEYKVSFHNFAVSGARASDVLRYQVKQAAARQPDVVLLAVGANDVTHLTSLKAIQRSMVDITRQLRNAKPSVKIVLTGAPAMGSVPRFPWPTRYFAGVRTGQVNEIISSLANGNDIVFAPIAAETGPLFARHPELFAEDKFHPNTKGYNVWVPVLTKALSDAIRKM
jgi:lysophospholipase L1-like esterase